MLINLNKDLSLDTRRKLNAHKTIRRRPGCLLNVLCTFNLYPAPARLFSWHLLTVILTYTFCSIVDWQSCIKFMGYLLFNVFNGLT